MSIPHPPAGAEKNPQMKTASALHSFAIRLLRRARIADKESPLNPERLSLLSVLAYAGPQTINRLAAIEAVSAPAISRMVAALERDALVARKRDSADARVVHVRPTAKGRRLMERARLRRIELIANDLALLSPQEMNTLARVTTILEKLEARRVSASAA